MSDIYERKGKIIKMSGVIKITDTFEIMKFHLISDEGGEYPQTNEFQVNKKNFEIMKPELLNKNVTVSFFLNGRAVQGKGVYNTLTAFRIEPVEAVQPQSPQAKDEFEEDSIPF